MAYTRTNKGVGFNRHAGKSGPVYQLIVKDGYIRGRKQLTGRDKGRVEIYPPDKIRKV